MQARRGLWKRLDPGQLLNGAKFRLGRRRRLRFGNGLDDRLEGRSVLDGLLERLERRGLPLRLRFGLRFRLRLRLLLLRSLGRPEELRERALTHAGALSRH